ncbi:MAG: UDP-N-acetylmuramate dehydrogenase [Lachnospiraceae bacterium]|nr:UDP-N-acetylmuramate dehydrogenase [Lachnospiraceae bacterium]
MISSIELSTLSGGTLKKNVPLHTMTTFKTGGPADYFVTPETEESLVRLVRRLKETETPYFVLGRGSNVLVSDAGYRGVVISLRPHFSFLAREGERITAGSGVMLHELAGMAVNAGLSGLEFAAGIPGTVGGAVRMNAGAYDGEMKQVVVSARVLSADGEIRTLSNEELRFRYRGSAVSDEGLTVLSAVFQLTPGDPEKIREKMDELMQRRREKQPLEYGSAGSTFKRPAGHYAGGLIEQCGLKGLRIGDACVSEKHAGFIINLKNATSADICCLIRKVQEEVRKKTGVQLEPEVLFLGEF